MVRVRSEGVLTEDGEGDPGVLDRYVTPALGPVTLSKLRVHDLDRFYATCRPTAAQAVSH